MRKLLFVISLVLYTLIGFSQGITVTVGGVSATAENTDSLGGKGAVFYVDTATNQSISGIKTFTQNVGIGAAIPAFTLDVESPDQVVAKFKSTDAGLITRILIDAPANAGFQLGIAGVSKFSNAVFQAVGTGANPDFTLFNEQTGIVSLFIDGNTDNVGIRTGLPLERLYIVGGGIGGADDDASIARWKIKNVGGVIEIGSVVPTAVALVSNNTRRLFIGATTGNIGIGTIVPDAVSIFEIASTTKGAINAPLMTEAQRDAISTPPEGLKIWNADTKKDNSFNGTIWEQAAFQPENVIYVTQESDFGTPSGGAITLKENTVYILYNDDPEASQKTITLTNRLIIPDAGGLRITSVGIATFILSYTGTGNFITTTSSFTGFLHIDELFISVPNGTLFDIDGVLPVGSEFFPRVFLSDIGFFDIKNLGIVKNISYNQAVSGVFDCKQGITFDHCEEIILSDIRFTDWQNDVGSVMITFKDPLRFPKISNCIFETKPNETVFDFQPSIPADDVAEVSICIFKGTGSSFVIGTTSSITAIADVSSSGSITAVSGTPFGEVIFIDAAHGLSVHQFITTSTFSDANYNGTFEVLEVLHPDSFRVHTLFTATETGSWTSDLIEITSTAHGLSDETGVQILNTSDNDGGGLTFNVAANTFEINGTFVSTSTGDWNTNSLTQKDTRVFFNGNSGLINSQSVAIGTANANATITSVTDGAYANITLTGFVADVTTERFELTTAANGVWTYIDSKPLSGIFHATISGLKSGATANYRFAISVNGATPVFASAVFVPMEVRTTKVQVTLALPASLVQGDTVQIMQAGDGTSDNITITDISMLIK